MINSIGKEHRMDKQTDKRNLTDRELELVSGGTGEHVDVEQGNEKKKVIEEAHIPILHPPFQTQEN